MLSFIFPVQVVILVDLAPVNGIEAWEIENGQNSNGCFDLGTVTVQNVVVGIKLQGGEQQNELTHSLNWNENCIAELFDGPENSMMTSKRANLIKVVIASDRLKKRFRVY